ncbi:MAG: hypothetical protein OXH64_11025, partial [Rhodospirillaceae bacterium]|nr:hypothetical protein [Rhodospirillaceae bacterium]
VGDSITRNAAIVLEGQRLMASLSDGAPRRLPPMLAGEGRHLVKAEPPPPNAPEPAGPSAADDPMADALAKSGGRFDGR